MSHVLIVEDDRDTRAMMAAWVATQGHTVSQAGSVEGARARMTAQTPDLVLLDLHLPTAAASACCATRPVRRLATWY